METIQKVLDHGYVKFIASMGTDESIIEAARMSTGRGFERWNKGLVCVGCRRTKEDPLGRCARCYEGSADAFVEVAGDAKLLEFLYRNKHMTPFEMCELQIEVQAPIMVFREWHRHRTQSYNEFSARYAQMPNLHYLPDASRIQKQSASNKQGGDGVLEPLVAQHVLEQLEAEQEAIYEQYDSFVNELGIAKEVARLNTPVSRYSKMRAKANLRNWLGFLLLRKAPNAQWEIRQYADAVGNIVQHLWPRTYALFMEYDFNAVHLSATEAAALREYLAEQVRVDTIPAVLGRLAK